MTDSNISSPEQHQQQQRQNRVELLEVAQHNGDEIVWEFTGKLKISQKDNSTKMISIDQYFTSVASLKEALATKCLAEYTRKPKPKGPSSNVITPVQALHMVWAKLPENRPERKEHPFDNIFTQSSNAKEWVGEITIKNIPFKAYSTHEARTEAQRIIALDLFKQMMIMDDYALEQYRKLVNIPLFVKDKIFHKEEGLDVEFKGAKPNETLDMADQINRWTELTRKDEPISKIARTVADMLNTIGGSIYIGIHDEGQIQGVKSNKEHRDKYQLKVAEYLRGSISPPLPLHSFRIILHPVYRKDTNTNGNNNNNSNNDTNDEEKQKEADSLDLCIVELCVNHRINEAGTQFKHKHYEAGVRVGSLGYRIRKQNNNTTKTVLQTKPTSGSNDSNNNNTVSTPISSPVANNSSQDEKKVQSLKDKGS